MKKSPTSSLVWTRLQPEQKYRTTCVSSPDPWHEDQFNDFVDALEQMAENVPDEFALAVELDEPFGGPIRDRPLLLQAQLRLLRTLMHWAWAWAIVLIISLFYSTAVHCET